MFVLRRANIACRQRMTVNLLQKHFKQLLYYTVSNWYYILTKAAISNQIKYYLTARREFSGDVVWLLQVCFTYRVMYYGLLLKEHLPRTQEKLERDCLEHHCKRSLKLRDWSSTQIKWYPKFWRPPAVGSCPIWTHSDRQKKTEGWRGEGGRGCKNWTIFMDVINAWSLMSIKSSLLTGIPKNFSPWLWL